MDKQVHAKTSFTQQCDCSNGAVNRANGVNRVNVATSSHSKSRSQDKSTPGESLIKGKKEDVSSQSPVYDEEFAQRASTKRHMVKAHEDGITADEPVYVKGKEDDNEKQEGEQLLQLNVGRNIRGRNDDGDYSIVHMSNVGGNIRGRNGDANSFEVQMSNGGLNSIFAKSWTDIDGEDDDKVE